MTLVLDASMALAWLIKRKDPVEAQLAVEGLDIVRASGAEVPALWFPEIANALLVAERQRVVTAQDSASYLDGLSNWEIVQDEAPPALFLNEVLSLSRTYKLTAYDATYLELAMRNSVALATFDRPLATASRAAGVRVFGDPA
ncbi:MAG: type II toxin-antitoxin system VapC family toxin [Terracidiphilus sp.]